MSASTPMLPMWYRVFAVVVGALSIVVAMIVLVDPFLAIWLLILLLALGLLFMGMDRLAAGITGHPSVRVVGMVPLAEMRETPSAGGQTPPSPKP